MKIAIFGASGRVGRNFSNFCLQKKLDFVAVTRNAQAKEILGSAIPFKTAQSVEEYKKILEEVDCVVNLVGSTNFNLNYEQLYAANTKATEDILAAAKAASIKKFVHISSIAVYKTIKGIPTKENSSLEPNTNYGLTKLQAEKKVLSHSNDFEIVILQPAIIYGPDFREGFYPVLKKIKEEKMPIIGSGNNHIPLVFYKDLLEAIFLALKKKFKRPERFLIVQQPQLTQKELFVLAAKILNKKTNFYSIPLWLAKLGVGLNLFKGVNLQMLSQLSEDRIFDCSKAEKELGWRAKTSFEDGIKLVVKSFFNQDV
ncbi:MAG: NAD(P)-dependent oxidoreductase [Candidatus Micrarchaeota archaeon]|nr:NAD(P)-dependent oxidoreductase [Candidatus Micrarchaeota archaeon]